MSVCRKFFSREREATSTAPFRGIHGFNREGGKFARAKKCADPEQPCAFRNVGQIEPHVFRAAVLKGLSRTFTSAPLHATPKPSSVRKSDEHWRGVVESLDIQLFLKL
ncbi:hypothetical protein AVEN_144801-1 [Araneus ventricosus]|uniref:Uncharacterized protein n=1 Tax=Araneus ventricosus TaxID=182803 RepID=A0A4Y2NH79_ARAVE|nr:hypothetical protein AVEN_144801-1 [Araneus ventricosus]